MTTWLVCGSRDAIDRSTKPMFQTGNKWVLEENLLKHITKEDKILLGGARGVDKAAEDWAKENNIAFEVFYPVNAANKAHYLYRNCEMIALASHVLAFWDGISRGTKFVIDYARARNKTVIVVKL
jgi:predicted Rossmann fold nucleotide-binding protein DprA/Smf involved in DNA uptake